GGRAAPPVARRRRGRGAVRTPDHGRDRPAAPRQGKAVLADDLGEVRLAIEPVERQIGIEHQVGGAERVVEPAEHRRDAGDEFALHIGVLEPQVALAESAGKRRIGRDRAGVVPGCELETEREPIGHGRFQPDPRTKLHVVALVAGRVDPRRELPGEIDRPGRIELGYIDIVGRIVLRIKGGGRAEAQIAMDPDIVDPVGRGLARRRPALGLGLRQHFLAQLLLDL
ncbi:hypothetical protein QU38_02775, partial [Staphylococcus aureus]